MSGRIGRFFSAPALLAALGLLIAGALLGGYLVYRVQEEGRISIGGFVLAGALVLAAVAAATRILPKGCQACHKKFEETRASFPADLHDPLFQTLARGDANALQTLTSIPFPGQGEKRATLVLELCQACARVGIASVATESWTGSYWNSEKTSAEVELFDDRMQALKAVMDRRVYPG